MRVRICMQVLPDDETVLPEHFSDPKIEYYSHFTIYLCVFFGTYVYFEPPNKFFDTMSVSWSFDSITTELSKHFIIIIWTLLNLCIFLVLHSNLNFKENEMESRLKRFDLDDVKKQNGELKHYIFNVVIIFVFLFFMFIPEDGYDLFSILILGCNIVPFVLLLSQMSNKIGIYDLGSLFLGLQIAFFSFIILTIIIFIEDSMLIFFVLGGYIGLIIVMLVFKIAESSLIGLMDKIREENKKETRNQELLFADVELAKHMMFDPDWRERINLSPQDIFDSLNRLEDFFRKRNHNSGKWFIAILEKPFEGELTHSEIIKNLHFNTKLRMRSKLFMWTLTALIPIIFIFRFAGDNIQANNFNSPLGSGNTKKCNQLLQLSKRYFRIEMDKSGNIISVNSKYSDREILPNDGQSKFSTQRWSNWLSDYCTLSTANRRISLLETSSIWFEKDGLVDTLIRRADFTDEYLLFIAWKRIDWLHDDFTSLDADHLIGKNVDIFPQFSTVSIQSNIDNTLQNWLDSNSIQRDCELTIEFLSGLKKAELHAHIGGVLDVESQIAVGKEIWGDLSDSEKEEALESVRPLIELSKEATISATSWPTSWPSIVRGNDLNPRKKGARAAAILTHFETEPNRLEWCLFPSFKNRWSKRLQMTGEYFGGVAGYAGYAVPGDLMGSTTLSFIHSEGGVVRKYAEGISRHAKMNNLAYLEIRLSPTKYRDDLEGQIRFIQSLGRSINASMDKIKYEYRWRFVISADRSKFEDKSIAEEFMTNFEHLLKRLKSDSSTKTWIAGYDVAGKEKTDDISGDLLKRFNSLNLELRLKSTFHAGEQADFNNLRSAYQIHTKRVGHALKLIDDEPLMAEFIKTGICIEMCPTSNIEVHGYRVKPNSYYSQKGVLAKYPLREYIDSGVKVAICTDNPFISRTDLNNEFITASDLCLEKPLTFYEVLKLIFNSFDNSFIDEYDKQILVMEVGSQILSHVKSMHMSHISQ